MKGVSMDQEKVKAMREVFGDEFVDELLRNITRVEAQALADGVEFKDHTLIRLKQGVTTFPPGTMIGDLTIDQFTKWWNENYTQMMLDALTGATATKAGPGPKLTPADQMDSRLDLYRQASTAAALRHPDADVIARIDRDTQDMNAFAGMPQGSAGGSLLDNQKPATKAAEPGFWDAIPARPGSDALDRILGEAFGWSVQPTTKAAEPAHPMEHFVQGLKASASAAIPNPLADAFGWKTDAERK